MSRMRELYRRPPRRRSRRSEQVDAQSKGVEDLGSVRQAKQRDFLRQLGIDDLLTVVAPATTTPEQAMTHSIDELIRTFYRAFSGKPELLDDVVADDWDDIPLGPDQAPGRAGATPLIQGIAKVFGDFHIVVHQIVDGRGPDGNGPVGVRGEMRGVHTGQVFGIEPTGREVTVRIHEFHELADGRIVRTWHMEDWLSWFQQVDVLPTR
ncbi:ester cyclase [Streptomyces sp. NPDC001795]|uniref:ester cyclase n=1 Tax=unclassified Streptomyces TaxID=2593676 RepID=UPI0033276FCC